MKKTIFIGLGVLVLFALLAKYFWPKKQKPVTSNLVDKKHIGGFDPSKVRYFY